MAQSHFIPMQLRSELPNTYLVRNPDSVWSTDVSWDSQWTAANHANNINNCVQQREMDH